MLIGEDKGSGLPKSLPMANAVKIPSNKVLFTEFQKFLSVPETLFKRVG